MKPFSDLSKSNDISESKVAFIVTCHTLESCVFNIIYIYIYIYSFNTFVGYIKLLSTLIVSRFLMNGWRDMDMVHKFSNKSQKWL